MAEPAYGDVTALQELSPCIFLLAWYACGGNGGELGHVQGPPYFRIRLSTPSPPKAVWRLGTQIGGPLLAM